jgi:alpha-tubulin suppressor-like RCC1 family protein
MTTINLGKVKINWKGTWSSGSNPYYEQDVVRHSDGNTYICIVSETNATPSLSSTSWQLYTQSVKSVATNIGDLVYINNAGNVDRLPVGNTDQTLKIVNGVPSWVDDTIESSFKSVKILAGNEIKNSFIGVIMQDGSVKMWGNSINNQLGDGTILQNRSVPVLVPFPRGTPKIVHLQTTYENGCFAIDESGQLWAWGGNANGQLGTGDLLQKAIPVNVSNISSNNSINGKQITQIASFIGIGGGVCTVVLDSNGQIHTCGNNTYGQLGRAGAIGNANFSNFVNISTITGSALIGKVITKVYGTHQTFSTCYALTNTGEVISWGFSQRGQLGLGPSATTAHSSIPTVISYFTNANIIVKDILPGSHSAIAIATNGKVYGWGWNNEGHLGLGDSGQRGTPAEITTTIGNKFIEFGYIARGDYENTAERCSTYLVDSSGAMFAAGYNGNGSGIGILGTNNTTQNNITTFAECIRRSFPNSPNAVGFTNNKPIKIISGGRFRHGDGHVYAHTLVLDENGNVWAVGRNNEGQGGVGNNTHLTIFEQVLINKPVIDIQVGGINRETALSVFITNDLKTFVCGTNTSLQLAQQSSSGNLFVPNEVIF